MSEPNATGRKAGTLRDGGRAGHHRPTTAEASEPLTELEVLQGVSRAFGSSPDLEEAAASAVRWVKAAVGADDAVVRIFLVAAEGALYPAVPRIEAAEDPQR